MFHNETIRNVLATVAAAAMVGGGGLAFNVSRKVDQHDMKIVTMEKQQDEILAEVKAGNTALQSGQNAIISDVGTIKVDVAILRERTDRLNHVDSTDKSADRDNPYGTRR